MCITGQYNCETCGIKCGDSGLKLNLGCGDVLLEGYENSDIDTGSGCRMVDLTKPLPYADNSVEAVVMSHTLCLMDGKRYEILDEIARVLKPNGWLRLMENAYRFYFDIEPDDIHAFPREFITQHLKDLGFKLYMGVENKSYFDNNSLKARGKHALANTWCLEAQLINKKK